MVKIHAAALPWVWAQTSSGGNGAWAASDIGPLLPTASRRTPAYGRHCTSGYMMAHHYGAVPEGRRRSCQLRREGLLEASPAAALPNSPRNRSRGGASDAQGVYLARLSGPKRGERAGLGALWARVSGASGTFRTVSLRLSTKFAWSRSGTYERPIHYAAS
jgi:hypothetical protein